MPSQQNKNIVKALKKALKERGHEVPFIDVCEVLSQAFGFKSWNAVTASGFQFGSGTQPVGEIRPENEKEFLKAEQQVVFARYHQLFGDGGHCYAANILLREIGKELYAVHPEFFLHGIIGMVEGIDFSQQLDLVNDALGILVNTLALSIAGRNGRELH